MSTIILLTWLLPGADLPAEQHELLQTFRNEFVELTPGQGRFPPSFLMGGENPNERPPHTVTLTHPFAMAKYEVPQNLWEAVMGRNPSRWKGERNSVEMVSFDEAAEFCRRATTALRQAGLIGNGQRVRLPTEAEWEYAARAGTTTKYSFGDDPALLAKYGWFNGNAAGNDPPVGAKDPNPWGLYDVHGYLWEWCSDPWHDDYSGAPADAGVWSVAGDRQARVLRSGSWKDQANRVTSATRRRAAAQLRDDAVGLRCVLADDER